MYYSSFFVRFFMKHNLEQNLQIILNNYTLFKCPIFILYFKHVTDICCCEFQNSFFHFK